MINAKQVSPEFTLYNKGDKILIELDGAGVAYADTIEIAHRKASAWAKRYKLISPGLTEAFGRNRQFILGARGAWSRYKP